MPRRDREGQLAAMQSALDSMWNRVLTVIDISFTYKEALTLGLPKESRDVLLAAQQLVEPGTLSPTANVMQMTMRGPAEGYVAQFVFDKLVLVPKRAWLQDELPPALRAKFEDWVEQRLGLGIEYGRVWAVIKEADKLCATPAQLRKRFPAIRHLWMTSPTLSHLATLYANTSSHVRAPFLPRSVDESAFAASHTLAGFSLMPSGPVKSPRSVSLLSGPMMAPHQDERGGMIFTPW